ncbi:sporulation peptidase YabG [Desertibacillus haloalkaliphilus]|uniref:sporulation peptidase YabG n=1 Tax=Desertibacillus haloalkaliphilus TaxID=1328930 RepID=UPI001C25C6A5|nr:sporulation peptidase YabG [Desertibacillus haloalkaliphilus]MBU8908421.1 sporulation peptidase YabG [Desertibacillus haloalkaliphilus]
MKLNIGDIVARKSYNYDLLFRIVNINEGEAELYGEDVRLIADAPIGDLKLIDDQERKKRRKQEKEKEENCYRLFNQEYRLLQQRNEYEVSSGYASGRPYFEMRGRVLHIDGDPLYLKKCTELYGKLGVPVYGVHIQEKEMPHQITSLLEMVRPDILVITGHDAYMKARGSSDDIKSYRNSKHFAETVRTARKIVPQLDHLVIFAGACQSHFESILKSGANFASSPERVNIHALDPVYIVAKISLTPFMDRVGVWDVLRNTITGEKGIGGIETRGVLRRGMPIKKYDDE